MAAEVKRGGFRTPGVLLIGLRQFEKTTLIFYLGSQSRQYLYWPGCCNLNLDDLSPRLALWPDLTCLRVGLDRAVIVEVKRAPQP